MKQGRLASLFYALAISSLQKRSTLIIHTHMHACAADRPLRDCWLQHVLLISNIASLIYLVARAPATAVCESALDQPPDPLFIKSFNNVKCANDNVRVSSHFMHHARVYSFKFYVLNPGERNNMLENIIKKQLFIIYLYFRVRK